MESLSTIMEKEQSKAFTLYGAFFAFGNSQFTERAIPGIQYAAMGYGLICPIIWAKDLNNKLNNIYETGIKYQVEKYGAEKIIEYEYFNHETQLTKDNHDLLKAIEGHIRIYPDLFTNTVINNVCNKCFALAVTNNWF